MKRVISLKTMWIIAAAVLVVVIAINVISGVSDAAYDQGEEALKTSIMRAAASCYATEGYYPPTLDYIVDNYRIIIDDRKYSVFYDIFANNIAPDITVISIDR